MFKYVCKRLLQSMVTLVIVATTVFLLLRLMPEEGYFACLLYTSPSPRD